MHLIYVAIETGFMIGAVYGLMASGLTFIFGVTRVVNAAQGAVAVLGAYVSYALGQHFGIDPFVSLIVVIPIAFVLGAFVNLIFVRRIAGIGMNVLVRAVLVTLAVAIILQGVLEMVFGNDLVTINASYVTATFALRHDYIAYIYLFGFLLSAALVGLLYLFLYRTRLGRVVRIARRNRPAARLAGVDLGRIDTIVFGIGFAFAAAGGMVYGSINPFNPISSYDLITRLLAIAIIGGLGSVSGAIIAAIVLLVIESVTAIYAPVGATAVFYVALALTLVIRPGGVVDWNRVRMRLPLGAR